MNKKNIGYLLLILFLIAGCINKSKKIFLKEYYPSGKLLSSGWYINDSIPIDTIFKFYENGKISSIAIYDSLGNLNGPFISYFENGNKSQINTYTHGQVQGFSYLFNKSGKVDSKIFSLDGKQIGDYYGYDTNGFLRNYAFYWNDTTYFDYIEYDSIKEKKGLNNHSILFNNITTIRIDTIKGHIQKDCKIQLLISNPPKCRTGVNIEFISDKGFLIRKDSISNSSLYLVHIVLPDSLKLIKFSAIQYDSISNKFYNYKVVTKL